MKSLPQRLSHLDGHPAFVLAFTVVVAALAGLLFTRSQATSVNASPAADKPTHRQSKQASSEGDSPTLSIGEIKVLRANRSRATSATSDIIISIASAGWQPGETVEVSIYKAGRGTPDATFNLVADQSGRLINTKLMLFSDTNGLRYMIAVGRESERFVKKKFGIMSPTGGPFVNTFESTCTTFQTSFILGDTVCAQVTAIDTNSFTARFDWIDPDGIVQEMGPIIVASGQTDTFMIPAAGPNAKVGTWRVQITDVNDNSNLASQNFIVSAGGPQPEAIATFEFDCATPESAFIAGSTVCAKVTGIDAGGENTFQINWFRPDSSLAEAGPIVTMNNQTDTFMIPAGGPDGTWFVQLTRLSDGSSQTQANFTVTGSLPPCTAITCPKSFSVSNDPGQCGAVVNYPDPSPDGDCGKISCSPASGSFFPVGTTTVTCTSTSGFGCSFTVTVNDTQAPTITCPSNVAVVTAPSCQPASSSVVTFATPPASDNCPGVMTMCSPASGSTFPVGTTTVTCTATDASGNTASCSFPVIVFTACLQDDSNPGNVVLFNTSTGEYLFCCSGVVEKTGTGTVTRQGCSFTIQHNTTDRRVLIRVDFTQKKGNASLQAPPGTLRCTITDKNILNNTCNCGGAPPPP